MTQPTTARTTRICIRKHTTTTQPAEVVGRGFRKRDHALVWMVTSQSESNRWHPVTQEADGHLSCDCAGWQYRSRCRHCDAVRTLLAVEEAEWQASQPPTLTPAPVTRTDDERATAPLYRSNAPFGIFKSEPRRPQEMAREDW